ncbi:MAG TPA: tetratricopeptide repeat protein [Roseiflexaceae bacterium]|nr:tetratricopeptide repeat protein [Roseiflexaceae bacterium]
MAAGPRLLPLSPLGTIDTALHLYRRHARAYLPYIASIVLLALLMTIWIGGDLADSLFGRFPWPFGLLHLSRLIYTPSWALRPEGLRLIAQELLVFWLVQSMVAAVLLSRIARDHVGVVRWPDSPGSGAMLRVAPGVLMLLPVGLLGGLVAAALTRVGLGFVVLAPPHAPALLGVLALDTLLPLLLALVLVALLARFAILPQLILLEELEPRAALARCLHLTRGAYGRIVLSLLLLSLLGGLLAGLPLLLPNLALLIPLGRWSAWLPQAGLLLSNCVQTLLVPLPLLATTVLYVDLRVRGEGLDLLAAAGHSEQERARAALRAQADTAPAWQALVDARLEAYDGDGARLAVDEGLRYFPADSGLLGRQIALLLDARELWAARTEIRRWLARSPDDPAALCLRARLRSETGDWVGARAECDRLLRRFPDDREILLLRARIRLRTRAYDGAREDLLRLLAQQPDQAWCVYQIAGTYACQNRADDAFNWLERALALDPSYARAAADDEEFTDLRPDPRFRALALGGAGGQVAATQEIIHDEQR